MWGGWGATNKRSITIDEKKKQKNNAPKLMRVDRLPLDCGPALTVKLAAAVGTGEEER